MSTALDPLSPTDQLLALLQKALGHELPNRLLAIQGLTRLLDMDEGERLSPDGKDYLARMAAAAQRAHAFSKALAEVVRALRLPPANIAASVADEVRHSIAEVRQWFPAQVIDCQLPETGPHVRVPGASLRQVVMHLVRNACQSAQTGRDLSVQVRAARAGQRVELSVQDTGCGLAPDRLQRLFEPFAGRRADAAGDGLGLFLVRQLVESWGGALDVDSTPGQGSTFRIVLPTADSTADSGANAPPEL